MVTDALGDPFVTSDINFTSFGRRNGAALLGEFGFIGGYKMTPNFTLTAAYDFMWVVGISRAPGQVFFEVQPLEKRVNDNGHMYAQGLTLGAEFTW